LSSPGKSGVERAQRAKKSSVSMARSLCSSPLRHSSMRTTPTSSSAVPCTSGTSVCRALPGSGLVIVTLGAR
jgi:hypothetical protein